MAVQEQRCDASHPVTADYYQHRYQARRRRRRRRRRGITAHWFAAIIWD